MWMSWHVYPCVMVVRVFSMLMISCYFDWSKIIQTSNASRLISSVEEWVQQNYLTLNTSIKCKSMIVSRKKSQPYPFTVTLGGQWLEQVENFKYLGVLLSSNLSFSQLIQTISKARKIPRLLYRRFYKNTSNEALLQLYISLVRPHLEYASPVWNPYLKKDIKQLEDVEKFALKMITIQWDLSYQDLPGILDITSLQSRRVQSSLCTLFKKNCSWPLLLPTHFCYP